MEALPGRQPASPVSQPSPLSRFDPRRRLSTTQPLARSRRWDGGRNQRGKSEKTPGLGKQKPRTKAKQRVPTLLALGRRVSSRAPSGRTVTGEGKRHRSEHPPPFLPPPPTSHTEHGVPWCGISLGSDRLVPAVSPRASRAPGRPGQREKPKAPRLPGNN